MNVTEKDLKRCVAKVYQPYSFHSFPCRKFAIEGTDTCKIHSKEAKEKREKNSQKKYQERENMKTIYYLGKATKQQLIQALERLENSNQPH